MSAATQSLQGKVAIITGASSGLGRAIAIAYARSGATVVIADITENSRDPAESQPTHLKIREANGKATYHRTDVSDEKSVSGLVARTVEDNGRLDIMVNNAGVSYEVTQNPPPPIYAMTTKTWDDTMAINARGVFFGARAAAAQMQKQEPYNERGDRGSIVNIASVLGTVATANAAAYVSSKHLVLGLTKAAALDCAPHRIHVNALCPGWVATSLTSAVFDAVPEARAMIDAMHPLPGAAGGMAKPEDVVDAAVFLAGDGARWMTGAGMIVDGGYTVQ